MKEDLRGRTKLINRVKRIRGQIDTVERELARDLVLQVGYVGSQGHRLLASHDINAANPQSCLDIIALANNVERALTTDERECAEVLMLLAAVRGGINGLMAEVLEDHVRLHLLQGGRAPLTPDLGEELIDLVRAYLK